MVSQGTLRHGAISASTDGKGCKMVSVFYRSSAFAAGSIAAREMSF